MLRTALKPKWLGLLLVVVLVVVSFTFLGLWQFGVAQDKKQQETASAASAAPVEPLDNVLPRHTPLTNSDLGRRVTATGTYDASHQLVVTPRRQGEKQGAWVMTPLDVGGAYVPIVRGWVADPAEVKAPPTGVVTVQGVLAPPESAPDAPVPLPEGQVATIDLAALVNDWDTQVYSAFVIAQKEAAGPDINAAPVASWTPETVPPPNPAGGGLQWRNLAYALQWWFFAGFAVYMWVRMVREEAQADAAAEAAARGEQLSGSGGDGGEHHRDASVAAEQRRDVLVDAGGRAVDAPTGTSGQPAQTPPGHAREEGPAAPYASEQPHGIETETPSNLSGEK